jgi:hypothetical protein
MRDARVTRTGGTKLRKEARSLNRDKMGSGRGFENTWVVIHSPQEVQFILLCYLEFEIRAIRVITQIRGVLNANMNASLGNRSQGVRMR